MENQALKEFLNKIREQIELGETQTALDSLQSYLAAASEKLKNELSLYIARYKRLRREQRKGVITRAEVQAEQALLENALLEFLEEIPKFIKLVTLIGLHLKMDQLHCILPRRMVSPRL